MWDLLLEIEVALNNISGLKSVNIGTERGISSKDLPMARVDPVRQEVSDAYYFTGSIEITFAVDAKNDIRLADEQLTGFVSAALIQLNAIKTLSNETAWYDRGEIPNFKTSIITCNFKTKSGLSNDCNT